MGAQYHNRRGDIVLAAVEDLEIASRVEVENRAGADVFAGKLVSASLTLEDILFVLLTRRFAIQCDNCQHYSIHHAVPVHIYRLHL